MRPAIRIDNLSKSYMLGQRSGPYYRTLRESLTGAAAGAWRGLKRSGSLFRGQDRAAANADSGEFWALKDVSFDVQRGEVVGIIGRNGAGKSTLLKILSRITEPTSGRAEVRGRMGSLLEVGTGFHPELTGRENIYLNGCLLGMTRYEISCHFDNIAAFSEIEQFLDTPVKRYSSGMYVRLAFAVAAHLSPEILIVDEVLAVGDAQFQKKCLGKMQEVGRQGRTILFVSHNMAAILNLCQRVAVLERGRLGFIGESEEGVTRYLGSSDNSAGAYSDLTCHPNRRPGTKPIYRGMRLLDEKGNPTNQFLCGDRMAVELSVDSPTGTQDLQYAIVVEDSFGSRLFTVGTYLCTVNPPPLQGPGTVLCRLDNLCLAPGRYAISLWAGPMHDLEVDVIEQAAYFDIVETDFYGNGRIPRADRGRILMRSWWET
jgi:lipopolysaccharide transport system ATP-binding protein